jgi:hypothetical protein
MLMKLFIHEPVSLGCHRFCLCFNQSRLVGDAPLLDMDIKQPFKHSLSLFIAQVVLSEIQENFQELHHTVYWLKMAVPSAHYVMHLFHQPYSSSLSILILGQSGSCSSLLQKASNH